MLDRLTLDQLRILIAVADSGSFSAAARQLGRVQSAVSQSVQSLEATLGIALFDRGERTPKLSEAGRALLVDAREIVSSTESLRAHAESIVSEVEPELSLAVDAVLPADALRASLKALSHEFPRLPVTLFTEGLGGAEQRLRDRVARLGIYMPLPTGASADLIGEFLASNPMMPVVASDHPLAKEPSPLVRRGDRAPCATRHHGSHAAHRGFPGQCSRSTHLAVRRHEHPSPISARRLRVVLHARSSGGGAYRRRAADEARYRRASRPRIQLPAARDA